MRAVFMTLVELGIGVLLVAATCAVILLVAGEPVDDDEVAR